jgi:hypothetical protein
MNQLVSTSPVSRTIPFDNATNGFVSTEAQSAIEEARNTAEGLPRSGLPLTTNGTISTGNWITYTELLADPRILFPSKLSIKEITWINSNKNLGAFNFLFYKNGQAAGNIIYTYTAPAADRTNGYGYQTELNLVFNPGDSLYIQYVKPSGTSLSDLALVPYFVRVS